MKKRFLALTLAVILVMALTTAVSAQSIQYLYVDNGTSITITGYIGNETEVVIPSEIDGKPVTDIADFAFVANINITSIEIPDSVTSIGMGAFVFTGIESISISQNVANIGYGAFAFCPNLTQINTDENNPVYKSVKGVLFSKDLTVLKQYPAGITSDTYKVPDSVSEIAFAAFDGNNYIVNAVLPDGLITIGEHAFEACASLESITIPGSVTDIRNPAFASCPNLKEINVDNKNPAYKSIGGILYNKDLTNLVQYPGGIKDNKFIVSKKVSEIACGAFYGNEYIEKAVLHSKVTTIGDNAFESCTSLKSIDIPDSVTAFGGEVFLNCSGLSIYGKAGSAAETYANDNGINFVD